MSVCQYCLADARYTKVADDPARRCPVCGADYVGPRRDREHVVLVENGALPPEGE